MSIHDTRFYSISFSLIRPPSTTNTVTVTAGLVSITFLFDLSKKLSGRIPLLLLLLHYSARSA